MGGYSGRRWQKGPEVRPRALRARVFAPVGPRHAGVLSRGAAAVRPRSLPGAHFSQKMPLRVPETAPCGYRAGRAAR